MSEENTPAEAVSGSDMQESSRGRRGRKPKEATMSGPEIMTENKSEYVLVGCKIPNGLKLRLFRPMETYEPVIGGGSRKVTKWTPTGVQYELHGSRVAPGKMPNYLISLGAAYTRLPREFWDKWVAQNKECALLRNNVLWAVDDDNRSARDAARDAEKIRSGLGPLVMGDDVRLKAPGKVEKAGGEKENLNELDLAKYM